MSQHDQPSDTPVHEGMEMPGQRHGQPGHHPDTLPDTVGLHGMLLTGTDPVSTHSQHEDFPWTIAIVDHPPRKDSAGYVASRRLINHLAATV